MGKRIEWLKQLVLVKVQEYGDLVHRKDVARLGYDSKMNEHCSKELEKLLVDIAKLLNKLEDCKLA